MGEEGDSGRGHYAGEAHADLRFLQSAGYLGGDPGARFAGIHADYDSGIGTEMAGYAAQSLSEGMGCGGVERKLSGSSTDAVGSE